jgi:hypothetical protein
MSGNLGCNSYLSCAPIGGDTHRPERERRGSNRQSDRDGRRMRHPEGPPVRLPVGPTNGPGSGDGYDGGARNEKTLARTPRPSLPPPNTISRH